MPEQRPSSLAAIVVAGGGGTRMGGIDKPGLELAGTPLRERALAAARAAALNPIVHLGPEVDGGPVAALAAGLMKLADSRAEEVVVLAGDLVRPDRVIDALLEGGAGQELRAGEFGEAGGTSGGTRSDGAVLVDPDGRSQWLAARYRIDALRSALTELPGGPRDASLHALVHGLRLHRVLVDREVAADIDSWQDYETAKGQVDD